MVHEPQVDQENVQVYLTYFQDSRNVQGTYPVNCSVRWRNGTKYHVIDEAQSKTLLETMPAVAYSYFNLVTETEFQSVHGH